MAESRQHAGLERHRRDDLSPGEHPQHLPQAVQQGVRRGAASNGFVPAEQWATLIFAFGENATDVYLDGTRVLHTTGALANSYADCAASGGYILVGADDSGDDDLFYLSDFRIYDGAFATVESLPGYVIWAVANGTTGAWNATDASGVHNVFRYLFDKPSATDDLAGTGATTYPLDADGETTIPASDKPARFFRLRVTER